MALLFKVDRVKYTCFCGHRLPLCKLYLCRYCKQLRCKICVSYEPDNFYCPNCIDGITMSEVRERKNQCLQCHNCPSCGNTLTNRITSVQTPNPDNPQGEPLQRKQMYLSCPCCRWTSRDADIPDVSTHTKWSSPKGDPEIEKLLLSIRKYWATVGAEEAMEAQTKKFPKRKSFAYKRDLFQRRRSSVFKTLSKNNMLSQNAIISDTGAEKASDIKPKIEASTEVEPLAESYWTQPLNINAVTSLNQRIANPAQMPETAGALYPIRNTLTIKRSLRCPALNCDHNLVKPEYVPQSIKFKLHLVAQLFVPEIRLAYQPTLKVNEESECVLTITNPTDSIIRVRLEPISVTRPKGDDEEGKTPTLDRSGDKQQLKNDDEDDIIHELNTELTVVDLLKKDGVEIGGKLSGLELASGESFLSPPSSIVSGGGGAGEAGEKENSGQDDEIGNVVIERRTNKIFLKTKLVPTLSSKNIMVGLLFHYQLLTDDAIANKDASGHLRMSDYENSMTSMSTKVLLDLGSAQ